jgi:hypothetical protein
MKNPISTRGLLMGMALTCTILVMVPLISGAAPLTPPPSGTVVPTFSGIKINNSTGGTVLDISGSGNLSNPLTGSNPINIIDTDGLQIFASGTPSNYMSLSPDNGISAKNTSGTAVPVKINDTQGVEIGDDTAAVKLKIDGTGNISNPTTNPVNINDSEGLSINTTSLTRPSLEVYGKNTAVNGDLVHVECTAAGVSCGGAFFSNNGVNSTIATKDKYGLSTNSDVNIPGIIFSGVAPYIKHLTIGSPLSIWTGSGVQLKDTLGNNELLFKWGGITNLGKECSDGPCPPMALSNSPVYIKDSEGLFILDDLGNANTAYFTKTASNILSTYLYVPILRSALWTFINSQDALQFSTSTSPTTYNLKLDTNGEISNPTSNPVKVNDPNGLDVSGRIRSGSDGNHQGGIWFGKEGVDYQLFMGQLDSTSLGIWNNGAWRFAVDSWGHLYNPTEDMQIADNLTILNGALTVGGDGGVGGITVNAPGWGGIGLNNAGTGGMTINATSGGMTINSTTGGLAINSTAGGGIRMNTTGGIVNDYPGQKVNITDAEGLNVSGKITAGGGIGTFSTQSINWDIPNAVTDGKYVTCPAGSYLTGCGFYHGTNSTHKMTVNYLWPSDQQCFVRGINESGATQTVYAYARCWNPSI